MGDIRTYKGEENWKFTELAEQSGREARAYFLWFKTQIEKRIVYLRGYLKDEQVDFTLDYSEESLHNLWIWYRECRDFVRSTSEKVEQGTENYPESQWNDSSRKELYKIIAGIRMDISLYFAETLIHNHPQLYWDYVKKTPKLEAYHQPVVMGFKNPKFFLTPWIIIQTCSANEVHGGGDNNILILYKVWEEFL